MVPRKAFDVLARESPEEVEEYAVAESAQMITHDSRVASARPKRRSAADRWFYVTVTMFVILVNVVGFSPSLVNPSTRTVPLPLTAIDLAHALVSVAWVLVFPAQVTLVAAGRPAVHRRLAVLGVLLSAAFIVVTWFMLVEGARLGFDLSGALVPRGTSVDPGTFLTPAGTLIPLGAFIAAAVSYRRRTAIHKRLMMLALLSSTGTPIAHVVGHWPAFAPLCSDRWYGHSVSPRHRRLDVGTPHPSCIASGCAFVLLWNTAFLIVLPQTTVWRNFAGWVLQ